MSESVSSDDTAIGKGSKGAEEPAKLGILLRARSGEGVNIFCIDISVGPIPLLGDIEVLVVEKGVLPREADSGAYMTLLLKARSSASE